MWLASVLEWAAAVCMALSVPLMLWQLGVGIMGLFSVRKLRKLEDKTYRFAVVSCARNEEAVIGQLLDSLQNQRYPRECFDLFVIADNCTDDTAAVARKHGAIVLERQDKGHIGKGYALRWAFERIIGRWGDRYDAVVLFDADNLADPDFHDHHDHFTNSTPESEWRSCLEHAAKIGLGSREYEVIRL